MADNLEIRVEQLTDAIRGLYNKPSLTPAEINNAFNTMLQRFENQTNLSSEKILQIITNEIRKTAEEKQTHLQEMLYGFEDAIKNAASQISNPKFDMQMSQISSDLNSVYSKINNQELQLQKFTQSLEALKTSGTAAEMVKLSNEFAAFSRGFENITSTLNNNFAEFLAQVQSYNQKDELNKLISQLEEIAKNTSQVVSAGERIDALAGRMLNISSKEDTNYINEKITILTSFLSDLKAYMEKNDIENKEQFRQTVSGIEQKLSGLDFSNVVEVINKNYNDIGEKLNAEQTAINSNLSQLAGEIQKVYFTVTDGITGKSEEIRAQLQTLNEDYQNLKNALVGISSNTNMEEVAKSIIKSNSETIELSHDFIQSQIVRVEEAIQRQEENEKQHLVNAVELLKGELSQVSDRIMSLEADLGAGGSAKAFEEPLNKIMECVESLKSADNVKHLSALMNNITNEINASISSLRENFEKAQDGSSIAVLQQLNEAVPKISDKLEIFRNHVVSENSANITELKQHFAQVIDTITSRVEAITASIKDEFKLSSNGGLDSVKVDLQNMSNHIMETVENINFNITREFNDHKTNIDEMLSKINDYEDKFRDKLNSIESTFETLNQEGVDRITDAISLNQLQTHETLNAIKSDILAGILGINKNSKTNFELLDSKLEQIIKKSVNEASTNVTSLQDASRQELLAEIENKVERCNLQQIHNGKELLGEIQNLNSELSFKIEALNTSANSEIPPSLIRGIDDKIQSLLESNVDKEEYVKLIKAHMDLRMKEVIQKIAKIVSVFKPDTEKEEDAQRVAASVKLDGLISQLEYLKDNIFAEIKDGFSQLDKKEEIIADIYKNIGEVLSNTVYIKNNAPNEFKDVLDEKLENLKNVEFLIEDLKNALQSNQISVLERINSLNDDLNNTRTNISSIPNNLEEEGAKISERIDIRMDGLREAICNELKSKIDSNSGETSDKIINTVNSEVAQKVEALMNQASERIASTIIDNVKDTVANIKIDAPAPAPVQVPVQMPAPEPAKQDNETYSMSDLEADLAKLRLSLEKSNKNMGADFQNIGGWLKNTNARLENLTKLTNAVLKKVDQTEKLGAEEIKNRLIQSEREFSAPGKIEDALIQVQKKYKIQEMRLEELDEKITLMLQKQSEGFDVKSFIDLFYDNTTQTKSLASRVESIESKLGTISKNIERIISYIDE